MMMTFCNNSVQSFLGSSNAKDNGTVDLSSLFHHTSTAEGQKPADGLEKTPHFSPLFSTSTTTMMTPTKRDPGGIGFLDDVGGSVDGLMSCTESLGFESSDERRDVDDQIGKLDVIEELCSRKQTTVGSKWKREHVKREAKKFPPPLSSLNQNGKPNFFLRPIRKDGKLELQEVKIGRPEILRAFRQDGRLRLHLIKNEDEETEEEFEEEEEEEEEEEVVVVEEEEENMQEIQEDVQQLVEEKTGNEEMEEKVEERVEGWQIPASQVGGGEGFLRCHEQVSHHQNQNHHHHHHHHGHHHHHDFHVWRQHCVTIR